MTKPVSSGSWMPLLLLFITGTGLVLATRQWIADRGLHPEALLAANLLFFLLSLLVYRMQQRASRNANPNVFVRAVMGGTMLKMAVVLAAAGVYAFAFKPYFNKATVVAAMCWYLLYLAVEVRSSVKLNKSAHG